MKFLSQFIFRSPLNPTNKSIDSDVFSEALYLSTPVLYEEYQKHLKNPITEAKELKKLNISLYKYQTRASNRCTPFGLFAGLSIGEWQSENKIYHNTNLHHALFRKTRLDMNVLCSLAQELSKRDFIKPYLKFYPNTSIYKIGDNYRYVEYYYKNNRRFHKINSVDFSTYLEAILAKTKKGLTQKELVHLLLDDEINEEEACYFIEELIESQILTNQLEPTVTGKDYFEVLIENLENINTIHKSNDLTELLFILNNVGTLTKNIDVAIFNPIESYKNIQQQLKKILPELSETNLFQTDLYKNTIQNNLDTSLQEQLKKTISFLNKITQAKPNSTLEEFKKRFQDRYEENEIPLLIALDTESGVGYPNKNNTGVNDLIDDLFIQSSGTETNFKWDTLQPHLLKLLIDSNAQKKKVIEISEADFKNIDFSKGVPPTTYAVMFKILNATTNKMYINNIGGSSAVNLLGRFAGGNKQLETIVNQITQFEQDQISDKILAEIVHLPESRTGNILARPNLRKYEISYLAQSSVISDFQIQIENLVLKIQNNKVILFDNVLQKEIIPRLGNAHNYSNNSLPVYHFLCDLQSQYFSKPYLGFNWGILANQFDFLPRVEFQNTVLSTAKWQLKKQDLEPLQDKKKTDYEKNKLFFELKSRINLPDTFLIAEGDNELLIDCNNQTAIDTFIDSIKNHNEITLEEYLFDHEHALIKDTEGNSFTNECIAIVLNENQSQELTKITNSRVHTNKQMFSIGSEWLYYKIYCGVKTTDYILTEKIKQITEKLITEEIIDQWFFIRYADPEVHLRFRLHITNFQKYGDVLQYINSELEPLINENIIAKIQTDTYTRELDRYGDTSIKLAEQLFYNDSVFVTNMLAMLDADNSGTIRWQIAIRSVDAFLNDFKLTLEEKHLLIEMLSNSFFQEHGGQQELKTQLNNKYRTLRDQLEEIMNIEKEEGKEYYPIIGLLNDRSESNLLIVDNILELQSKNQLQPNINELLASLLHMNIDRLFIGRNRTNEFIVYDLLARHYKSKLARIKFDTKTIKKK